MKGFEAQVIGLGTDKAKIVIPKEFVEYLRESILTELLIKQENYNKDLYTKINYIILEMKKVKSGGIIHTRRLDTLQKDFLTLLENLNKPLKISIK